MLGSINPLGERARGSRWGVTASWFAVAALVAGAASGLALGAIGSAVVGSVDPTARLVAFGVLVLAGAALDFGVGGGRPPRNPRPGQQGWVGPDPGGGGGARVGAPPRVGAGA